MREQFTEAIDRLGQIRADQSALRREEKDLLALVKNRLHNRKSGRARGFEFEAALRPTERVDTSLERIEQVFGKNARARLGNKESVQVTVRRVTEPAVLSLAG